MSKGQVQHNTTMKKAIFTFYAMFLFVVTATTQPQQAATSSTAIATTTAIERTDLSKKEARKIKRERAQIHAGRSVATADGVVTRKEKRRLKSASRKSRRHLVRESTDGNGF